jgi:hypothetical protein
MKMESHAKLNTTDAPGENPSEAAWCELTDHELAAAARDRTEARSRSGNKTQRQWRKLHDIFNAESRQISVNGAVLAMRNAIIESAEKLREPTDQQRQWVQFLLRQSAICIWLGNATDSFRAAAIVRYIADAETWWSDLHWQHQFSIWKLSRGIARDEKLDRRRRRARRAERRQMHLEAIRVGCTRPN